LKHTFLLQKNIFLAPLTTLKIGGAARFLAVARDEVQVAEAFSFAEAESLDIFVLGGGSNVLISDRGFDGMVLCVDLSGITGGNASVNERASVGAGSSDAHDDTLPDGRVSARTLVTAGAGVHWDEFVAFCVGRDLAGVECLAGIPGLVGATPIQNVGAYGQEVSETITSVRCFDRKTKRIVILKNEDCEFSYRTSIFNSTERDRYIVLRVTYGLCPNGEPKIVYKDLLDHFGDRRASLSEVRDAVLNIRRSKSMVIDIGDPNSRSVGSFFKNPVVEKGKFDELKGLYDAMPSFVFGDKVKIPAAWLIENAGFQKGFSMGDAGISSKHTLALINRGGASAEDVIALKQKIQDAVKGKFGIMLQPEPVFVGF
jgi:UDP-N-acetylmuramate dehydrogenase